MNPDCVKEERIELCERIVAFERGFIDPVRSAEFRETARIIKQFSDVWRPDFLSVDGDEVYKIFARGDTVHMMNGTWLVSALGELHQMMEEVAPGKIFRWSVFAFPAVTGATTVLPLAGGINQNAGMRACLIVPKQPDALWRQEAGVLFCQFLTSRLGSRKVFDNANVGDIPAMKHLKPKKEVEALRSESGFAFLPIAQFTGYDEQSYSEFWTAWQLFLGGASTIDVFLESLSRSHRQALVRLARLNVASMDHDFLLKHLGKEFR